MGTQEVLKEADRELAEHFTSAIGVRAQSYELFGASFDPRHADDGLVAQLGRRDVKMYDAVASTLVQLELGHRRVLESVYATGAGVLHEDARDVDGIARPDGDEAPADPYGLLKLALAPAWGHGSFVRLATSQRRVLSAFGRRYPDRATAPSAVAEFLAGEAGLGRERDSFFAGLRKDCEEIRAPALAAYEGLRRGRVKAWKEARAEEKRQREKRNSDYFDELRGRRTARESARFDRALRGTG